LPLLAATGPFSNAVAKLRSIDAGGVLASRIAALEEIAAAVSGRATLTLDPTERHGFEYQSWFGFTIFAAGYSAALGRGGTYAIQLPSGGQEVATGVSLFPDSLIETSEATPLRRLFLPLGTASDEAAKLRLDGWITIAALDTRDNAARLGCTHMWNGNTAIPVTA